MKKLKEGVGHQSNIYLFWRDLVSICQQEFATIFRDSGVMVFFFVVPLIYPLLYGAIYNKEVIREAPLVVVDEDHTSLSLSYVRRLDSTPDVAVVAMVTNQNEAKDLLDRKEAYGCLVIPKGFSEKLHNGTQSTISLISDLSSMFYYKAFMMATNDVALAMGREIVSAREFSGSEELTKILVTPVRKEFISLYNPQSGYATFLLPEVLILILQQTMLLGVCMLVGTARERSHGGYISPRTAFRRGLPIRVTLGRSLAYFIIYIVSTLWTVVIVPYIFGFPQLGEPLVLLVFLLPFILAITFFAQSIAIFIRGREDMIIYLVFSSILFMFLMGISWPFPALPPFWRGISMLIPSVPAAQGFVAINSYGATLLEVIPQYLLLWGQTLFYLLFASVGSKYLIKAYKAIVA